MTGVSSPPPPSSTTIATPETIPTTTTTALAPREPIGPVPLSVAPPPTAVAASPPAPGSRSTLVTWTAPATGPAPTAYQVRCLPVGTPVETGPDDYVRYVGRTTPWAVVDDLVGGRAYRCLVRARYGPEPFGVLGDADEGPLSAPSNVITVPVTVPNPVPDSRATEPLMPDGRSTRVSFAVRFDPSGAPILAYTARCGSSDGGLTRTATGVSSPIVVTGLSAGKRYACSVWATNAIGTSTAASFSASITVPGGPPGPVSASAATIERRWTTVRYGAPDGGPPVVYYVVACVPIGPGTARYDVTRELATVVQGLTPGATYRCRVNATYDERGAGPVSAWSNAVTVPVR